MQSENPNLHDELQKFYVFYPLRLLHPSNWQSYSKYSFIPVGTGMKLMQVWVDPGVLQVRDSGQPHGRSPETDGWMRKTWCHRLAVSFLWHSAQRPAVVSYVSVHQLLPKISSGLGGDPRGNHLLTDHGTCLCWFVFTSNYIEVMWNAVLNILSALKKKCWKAKTGKVLIHPFWGIWIKALSRTRWWMVTKPSGLNPAVTFQANGVTFGPDCSPLSSIISSKLGNTLI